MPRDRLLTFGATPARIHLCLVAGRPVLIGRNRRLASGASGAEKAAKQAKMQAGLLSRSSHARRNENGIYAWIADSGAGAGEGFWPC